MGEGIPIVLLHGWGANRQLMLPLAERLAPLGYRLFAPDLPGFGESAPPPVGWSVFEFVAFVLAYFDHHSLERANLFGHSFGGRLSLILGADHARRIDKIALADSAGVVMPTAMAVRLRQRAYKTLRSGLYRVGLRGLANALRERYSARYGSADYQAASGVMRETFVKVVNEDLLPFAARVQRPTFLFWGDQDEDTPLWQGQLLEKTIPDAALHVFPGAGHYSYLDRLTDTVRILDAFYKSD